MLKAENEKLGLIFGYQQSQFSWIAKGGNYDYTRDINQDGINGGMGAFSDGEQNTGYQQKFTLPYIGLAGQYQYGNYELNAQLKFSNWVKAQSNDEHYLRDLTFRENSNGSKYYSITIDAGYYITPNTRVFTELMWNHYKKTDNIISTRKTSSSEYISSSFIIVDPDDSRVYHKLASGASENTHYSLSLGLSYNF